MENNHITNDTPALVLDAAKLKNTLEAYKKIGTVYYPVKSNSAPEIIKIVHDAGCGFLVSCLYYLEKLLHAGVRPEKILYDNCAANSAELRSVSALGLTFFYTDSAEHFFALEKLCRNAHFLIKVSSDRAAKKLGKFGIADFAELEKIISSAGKLDGFGFYIGDSAFCLRTLRKQLAFIVRKAGTIEKINIGGSLKGLLHDAGQQKLLTDYKNNGAFKEILLEPGRNLLNPCITMETTVIKRRLLNGKERLVVDASIYSGLMDIYIEGKKLKISTEHSPARETVYHIYGKTSDSADYLGTHRLPCGIQEGDILSIADCGAYCYDMPQVYSGAKPLAFRLTP